MKKFLCLVSLIPILGIGHAKGNSGNIVPGSANVENVSIESDWEIKEVDRTPENINYLNKRLMEFGFPAYGLSYLEIEQKEELIEHLSNDNVELDKVTIMAIDIETGKKWEVTDKSIREGQIPDSYMSLTITNTREFDSSGRLSRANILLKYTWHKITSFVLDDPIAITWDSKYFQFIPDSFEFTSSLVYTNYNTSTCLTSKSYADISDTGVKWYTKLCDHLFRRTNYGSGKLSLAFIGEEDKEFSNIYAKYVHRQFNGDVSLTLGYGTITANGSGNWESLAATSAISLFRDPFNDK